MQVYIISIEDIQSPRWIQFISQPCIAHLDSNYVKVGVIGTNLSCKDYFNLAVKGRSKPLTPGELGCTLSHLEAMNQFLETDDDYALVFEDDALIPEDLRLDQLEQALKAYHPPQNLLFSLGGIQLKVCSKVRGTFKQNFVDHKVLNISPEFFDRVCYTFAYIVDRKMAKTLINYHSRIRRADDWSYLYDYDKLVNLYMTNIVDHPEITKDEKNIALSHLQAERVKFPDLDVSKHSTFFRKNLAKFRYTRYF